MRKLKGFAARVVTVTAVAVSFYALLYLGHVFERFGLFIPQMSHRAIILALLLFLTFMLFPITKSSPKDRVPWYDLLLSAVAVVGPLYVAFSWNINAQRYLYQEINSFEIGLVVTTLLAVLEATRRAVGPSIPLVAIPFMIHMVFGNRLPGIFHSPPVRVDQIVTAMGYSDTGIYGVALGTAATLIISFLIFSQFMFGTGAGDFFIDFARSLLGHVRGGPAKVAILASALMGMISGSTSANVAAVGVFTIPMMKKVGYSPEFAGAVETVASNGGQIMPPVMGLVAFVMAQWLGISYGYIALISFLPAFLYFLAVYIMVDIEAVRLKLRGLPRSECPRLLPSLKQGYLFFVPVGLLIFLMGFRGYSPQTSIFYSMGALLLMGAVKWAFGAYRKRKISLQDASRSALKVVVGGLRGGAINMVTPGIACACSGIILCAVALSQIGLAFSDVTVGLAGGNQLLILIFAATACFILGLGLSSLVCYIMVVIVVAPALVAFGVPPLISHMFVFWFAIVSFITPPVAVPAFIAAGIAKGDPMKTAWQAMRLGFCLYTLPIMFVYRPALLLQGSITEIILASIGALVGVTILSFGISGHFLRPTNLVQRLLLLAGGALFMTLDWKPALLGLAVAGVVMGWQMMTARRLKYKATATGSGA